MTDKELINLFVEYLAGNGNPGLKIDAWPDEENRQSSEIDAIAGPFAIEHSSVDTVPNQRRDSVRFLQVVKTLHDEFDGKLSFRLTLTLPYEGIQTGQNWAAITDALREWVLNEATKLTIGAHRVADIPGVPFEFQAMKRSSNSTGLFFGRFVPKDNTLPIRLKEQLDRKADKLSRYKDKGRITVLLVESDDIALMDDSKMWVALRQAYPKGLPNGVDQIWFADTSIPDESLFTDMTLAVNR